LNVNNVLSRVQSNLGDNSGVMAVLAEVIDLVNDAVLEVVQEIESPIATTSINVVAGTFEYALPADFVLCKRVTYNGHRLIASSIEELDAINPDAFNTALNIRDDPEAFFIENMMIGVYPIPVSSLTGGLTVRYVQKPADVTAGTDAVPLPVSMHPVVVRLVEAMYKERDEDYEAAAQVRGDALAKLNKIQHNTMHATTDQYPVIREERTAGFEYE
jgi:hypothetical protein